MAIAPGAEPSLAKPAHYYGTLRTDMVPHLPDPLGRVLDVGCAAGLTGTLLRPRNPARLVGIEINPQAAEAARSIYDEVLVGSAEEVLASLDERFDTILCYDVLEHLVDPWRVLARLAELSEPGARLHVSVPNVRHLSLMVDVMLRGTFNYQADGHRDSTHLRWFTPRDLESAVSSAGFEVRSRSHPALSAPRRALAKLTGGRSTEFLVVQWQVLAIRTVSPAHAPAPAA
ncbi:MAG: class I SAM-dependent methyltransferase [Solirubrobacteraceae bacterium]